MSDEGLHEIQLDGKQLVFLFMTATVVAVVIFLCGVMVGRGVPTQRGETRLVAEGADPTVSSEPAGGSADAPTSAAAAATPGASPSSQEALTYSPRLEDPEPVPESLREAAPRLEPFAASAAAAKARPTVSNMVAPTRTAPAPPPAPSAVPARAEAPAPRPSRPSGPAADKAPVVPAGAGFVVQVAAVNKRGEADGIRDRLARKGYPAFVTSAGASGATMYRVRVGKYETKREADSVALKLEREEHFTPWVTR